MFIRVERPPWQSNSCTAWTTCFTSSIPERAVIRLHRTLIKGKIWVSAHTSGFFTGRSWNANCFDKHGGGVWEERIPARSQTRPIKQHQRPASNCWQWKKKITAAAVSRKKIELRVTRWCLKWTTEIGNLHCHVYSTGMGFLKEMLFVFAGKEAQQRH